jgi:restriction system protein
VQSVDVCAWRPESTRLDLGARVATITAVTPNREPHGARSSPAPNEQLIPPHGGYQKLKSFQMSEIVYDATIAFCDRFIDKRSRTHDQMVQAARSGRQNIAEGRQASGTSRKTEIKLVGVARASLEELLLDYQDVLRHKGLPLWGKDHARAREVRALVYRPDMSYRTYSDLVERGDPGTAANTLICLIHQTCFLLDRQLRQLEEKFLAEGGFTERLYRLRKERQ